MVRFLGKLAGAAAGMAILVAPSAAIASSPSSAVVASATSAQSAASAWSTLSIMSSASTSSASLAAAQGNSEYRGGVEGIPFPVLAVWAAALGVFIWILVKEDDGDGFDIPISPA